MNSPETVTDRLAEVLCNDYRGKNAWVTATDDERDGWRTKALGHRRKLKEVGLEVVLSAPQ